MKHGIDVQLQEAGAGGGGGGGGGGFFWVFWGRFLYFFWVFVCFFWEGPGQVGRGRRGGRAGRAGGGEKGGHLHVGDLAVVPHDRHRIINVCKGAYALAAGHGP